MKQLQVQRILLKGFQTRKTKYFGHVKRHTSLLKTIDKGKRARERRRCRWEDNIKQWTGYSLAECSIKGKGRAGWRFITANLQTEDMTLGTRRNVVDDVSGT